MDGLVPSSYDSSQMEIFCVKYAFEATKVEELTLAPGEQILILDSSGKDWWFGRKALTGEEGWFPSEFGIVKEAKQTGIGIKSSALTGLSSIAEPTRTRSGKGAGDSAFRTSEEVLLELLITEEAYVNSLNIFRTTFLGSIRTRDSEEKRRLCYGNRAVSVSFELFDILQAHNQQLLQALKKAGAAVTEVAQAFHNFAPAQEVYALYSANHAEALSGVEKLAPVIRKYSQDKALAGGLTLERYLSLPVERFPRYVEFLSIISELLTQIPAALTTATKAMEEAQDHIDQVVDERNRQTELVTLQSQFMGYVDLYAPERRIIREGTLKKIYIDNSGRKPVERHMHLLSDALIYSAKLIGPYKYKVAKIHEFEHFGTASGLPSERTMFDISRKGEEAIRFQAPDEVTALEWIKAINDTIAAHKAKLETAADKKIIEPREARVNAVGFLKRHGLKLERLPERSRTIVYGIKADLTYIEYLKVFARVVGVTLEELTLGIGAVGGKRGSVEHGNEQRARGLFETKTKAMAQLSEGAANRAKSEAAKKPLQSPEFAIFLKVLLIVHALSESLVEKLEERLDAHSQHGTEFCIGDLYLGLSALFTAYTKYATVLNEAAQVLSGPALAEMAESLGEELAPLSMDQHLAAPMGASQRMAVQMKAILNMTDADHPDRRDLEIACIMLEQTATDMVNNQKANYDYWKLVSIRESITSMEFREARLDTLITSERKLLMEGSLMKACRSKDKPFMFWLFNDVLVYATHVPSLGGTDYYQLNRWLPLMEMRVQGSENELTGLDILTAEKSFTVYAKDEVGRDTWLIAMTEATKEAFEKAGISPESQKFTPAPILVQTTERTDCSICQTKFTLFNRKHHCLSCGDIVCDKCSSSRIILSNISKTERQRVCDSCVSNTSVTATGERVSAPRPPGSPVGASPPPANKNSAASVMTKGPVLMPSVDLQSTAVVAHHSPTAATAHANRPAKPPMSPASRTGYIASPTQLHSKPSTIETLSPTASSNGAPPAGPAARDTSAPKSSLSTGSGPHAAGSEQLAQSNALAAPHSNFSFDAPSFEPNSYNQMPAWGQTAHQLPSPPHSVAAPTTERQMQSPAQFANTHVDAQPVGSSPFDEEDPVAFYEHFANNLFTPSAKPAAESDRQMAAVAQPRAQGIASAFRPEAENAQPAMGKKPSWDIDFGASAPAFDTVHKFQASTAATPMHQAQAQAQAQAHVDTDDDPFDFR